MNQFERIEEEMIDVGKATPRQVKGGVFAPTDIKLIKEALMFFVKHNGDITDAQERLVVNLLHRINNRT